MFSILYITNFKFWATLILPSFNLDKSAILSFCKDLTKHSTNQTQVHWHQKWNTIVNGRGPPYKSSTKRDKISPKAAMKSNWTKTLQLWPWPHSIWSHCLVFWGALRKMSLLQAVMNIKNDNRSSKMASLKIFSPVTKQFPKEKDKKKCRKRRKHCYQHFFCSPPCFLPFLQKDFYIYATSCLSSS